MKKLVEDEGKTIGEIYDNYLATYKIIDASKEEMNFNDFMMDWLFILFWEGMKGIIMSLM